MVTFDVLTNGQLLLAEIGLLIIVVYPALYIYIYIVKNNECKTAYFKQYVFAYLR